MEKNFSAFNLIAVKLCIFICTTSSTWSAVAAPLSFFKESPPYNASFTLNTEGVVGDLIVARPFKRQSFVYGHLTAYPLYSNLGALLSLGGGYRQRVRSGGLLGGHIHLDSGQLPLQLGAYVKLSSGLEWHTVRGSLAFNAYSPSFLSTSQNFRRLQTQSDYTGHQAYGLCVIDQDQWSGDIKAILNTFASAQWEGGLYGAFQKNNPSIWGITNGIAYTWNQNLTFTLHHYFDNFRGNSIIGGINIQYGNAANRTVLQKLSWRPLIRHIAPPKIVYQNLETNKHHLFFDSRASEDAVKGTYENPSSQLNNSILNTLRTSCPPGRSITLHLSGHFNVADGQSTSLILEPNESIEGEFCAFDILNVLNVPIAFNELYVEVPSVKVTDKIKLLNQSPRLLDGRPLIIGSVFLNNNTRLRHLGFLPSVTNAFHKDNGRLSTPIIAQPQEGKRLCNISVQDVVITGWPSITESFQYTHGMDMTHCDKVYLDSVWINHAKTGIYLEDVTQDDSVGTNKSPLQSIYIGNQYLSRDLSAINGFKSTLRYLPKAAQEDTSVLYPAYQNIAQKLSYATIDLKKLFGQIMGIEIDKLPGRHIAAKMNIESAVLTGMQVCNGGAASPPKNLFNKAVYFATDWLRARSIELPEAAVTTLNIADSLIMAQGISLSIDKGFHITLARCLLESKRLGCHVQDSGLTWVGNLTQEQAVLSRTGPRVSEDSFVYIDGLNASQKMTQAVDNLSVFKDMKKEFKDKLPSISYINYTSQKKPYLETRCINTGFILVVPDHYWVLKPDISDKRHIKRFFLFPDEHLPPIAKGNTFSLIHSGVIKSLQPDHPIKVSTENGTSAVVTVSDPLETRADQSASKLRNMYFTRHQRHPSLENVRSTQVTKRVFQGKELQPLTLTTNLSQLPPLKEKELSPSNFARRKSAPADSPIERTTQAVEQNKSMRRPLAEHTYSSQKPLKSNTEIKYPIASNVGGGAGKRALSVESNGTQTTDSIRRAQPDLNTTRKEITMPEVFSALAKVNNDPKALPKDMKQKYYNLIQGQRETLRAYPNE